MRRVSLSGIFACLLLVPVLTSVTLGRGAKPSPARPSTRSTEKKKSGAGARAASGRAAHRTSTLRSPYRVERKSGGTPRTTLTSLTRSSGPRASSVNSVYSVARLARQARPGPVRPSELAARRQAAPRPASTGDAVKRVKAGKPPVRRYSFHPPTGMSRWGKCFADGTAKVVTTDKPMTVYRVCGGTSATHGNWLTPVKPESAARARQTLALPKSAQATMVVEVKIPAGTLIVTGVARALGKTGDASYRPGGGPQIFVHDVSPLTFGGAQALR